MGKIKSAWEIALEKTENIKVDENKIRHNEKIDKIRRSVGSYLISDNRDDEKLREELKSYTPEELKEALKQSVLNGLTLPTDEVKDDRYERLKEVLKLALPNNVDAVNLFDQITGFLAQYPLHKKQLVDQMKAQFEPMLRDKEEQMREKYGQEVHLTLETDKEFLQVLDQNLSRLDKQYNDTLSGARMQLESFFA